MAVLSKTKGKRGPAKKRGQHATVDFINCLCHTGDYYGVPFNLRPWQESFIRQTFTPAGKPRYEEIFGGLPRKQGKTELWAAILDFLIFGTGKKAQRLYSGSGDQKQAALIYSAAAAMIRQSQALSDVALTYDGYKRICCDPLGSTYEALSSEHALKYGLRPSVVMLDELWVFPNRDLYKALTSAFGATIEPLTMMISTAGWDKTSLCYEQWQRALDARDGKAGDSDLFSMIYAADPDDDWTSPDVWKKAMPALGDYCQLKFIEKECKKAQQSPIYENTFKQLYLNIWTEQAERWLSQIAWEACGTEFPTSDMYGQPCYAGYDHGVTGDMACLALVWPIMNGVRAWVHGWVPKNGKWRDEIANKDRYVQWERDGFLTFTEDPATSSQAVDEDAIEADIARYHELCPIMAMFADRAYATRLLTRLLNNHAIPVKGITQGPVTMNESCVRLEEMVLNGQIEHGGNPILAWNVANASVNRTNTGLMHLNKSSSTERIDGLAALLNALTAYIADPEHRQTSIYETQGVMVLG